MSNPRADAGNVIWLLLIVAVTVGFFVIGYRSTRTARVPTPTWAIHAIAQPTEGSWRFEYGGPDGELGTDDDVVSVSTFYLPASVTCTFAVTSTGAPTALSIPYLLVKSDNTPTTVVTETGPAQLVRNYYAAEYCGPRHSEMRGRVKFVDRDEFDALMRSLPRAR